MRCICLALFLCGLAGVSTADSPPTSYVIQTVAGANNSSDGGSALAVALSQPEGVAVDHAGNIYVAEAAGNRIRKIATDGSIRTVAGTGVAGFAGDGSAANVAQINQPYGIALDATGNLYIADLGNARVRKVALDGTIHTVAGGGSLPATNSGQGGPATMAQFMQPRNVAIDGTGSLYISDFGANQVYQVASDGILSLVAGTGTAGYSGVGTSALLAQLNAPAGLAIDPAGAVYVADSGNNLVRKIYNGVIINVYNVPGPTGVALDASGMLYVAAASYFGTVVQPNANIASARDVAVDPAGNIFATFGGFVLEVPSSGALTTVAGSGGSPFFGGDGGPAAKALLYAPSGIAADSSGNWYIADTLNHRLRMVTPAGVITTIAGTATAGSDGDNGSAARAELNSPHGVAIDSAGNLYIADSGNNAIREISAAGTITTIAGNLNNPLSLTLDSHGSIYVADAGNNRIAQVTASGTVSTFAKIPGVLAVAVDPSDKIVAADASQIWSVAQDGTVTSLAKGLSSPAGLAFEPGGTLLIADTGANVIRGLDSAGVLTAIAGNGTAGFSGDGSFALSAELNAPAAIAIGPNGAILIADSANNRIRSLTPATASPDTAPISVVNAASLAAGPITGNEIVTVFGTGFDSSTELMFNGKPAKLFYTSTTQLNALAPDPLAVNSTAKISIVVGGATVAGTSVPVAAAAPGIFTTGATGQAAALNQDGSVNSATNPAARGSIVSIFATGWGSNDDPASMSIAGYDAPVLYSGPAPGFPGLTQINAQIPEGFLPPGIQAVILTVDGISSQAGVTIAIR
ncbi:MAG TPA: IPT/TIG domain-containing protein [Bryobacteraceae bacterium]|nr:IPT/TIG domain-containing protein [Bryobacteraceae bacterium]